MSHMKVVPQIQIRTAGKNNFLVLSFIVEGLMKSGGF